MSHFDYDIHKSNVYIIPIEKIGISNPIKQAVISLGGTIPSNMELDSSAPSFGSLQRLYNYKTFKNNKIPPIVVKKTGFAYYSIIDGRHRVAMSIAAGFTEIPVIYQ